MKQPGVEEVRMMLQRMSGNAADAAALAPNLPGIISKLPPPSAQLMSRPRFERATLWSYDAQFEFVEPSGEAPPQNVIAQRDLWVRGIEVQVIAGFGFAQTPTAAQLIEQLGGIQAFSQVYGANARGAVELNWRLDGRQGFISLGTSETLESATLISGDGTFFADVDWQLQKEQVIEVRCRSRVPDIDPTDLPTIRWVVVSFWCEDLDNPSVR